MCVVVCCGLFASCEMKETPVPPLPPGEAVTSDVSMGGSYAYQVFFDLETNTAVSKNQKVDWDLGFEASAEGFHVVLNTGKSMFAYDSGTSDFNAADSAGKKVHKLYDVSSGNLDSTAIGDWRTDKHVFFIDRGYDPNANALGFKKIQVLSVDDHTYQVKMSNLDGSGLVEKTLEKDSAYNFMFLSLESGNLATVEPPKTKWDIAFTQYTTIFYDPDFLPYLVTGCLINRYHTSAAADSVTAFGSIDQAAASGLTFATTIDVIGYDWKTFDGTRYTVNPAKNYVIKNRNGYYYKLHFLDFYGVTGEKGNPVFEFQRL